MTIFNEDECPFGNNTCTKSDYIKVMFFGGTNDTQKYCKCGTEASRDVFLTHEFMSNLIGTSKVYGDIIDLFLNSGYETGFSLGGIPNDFRKFVATNTFATEVFRYLIESFYNYTGKPVIIIAHSFGNLIALHNLVSEENEDLLPKIKKFVSIGPPFSGSTKLLDGYLHGLKDFNKIGDMSYYYPFGQSLLFKSVPTVTELRPLPIFSKLMEKSEYKEFVEAIKERINSEKEYINNNYSITEENEEKFDKLFSSYFPRLKSNACNEKTTIANKLHRKCFTNIFDIFDYQMIIALDNIKDKKNIEYYCNKSDDNLYYINEMGEERKSIEELLTKGRFTYGLPEMKIFLDKYNNNIKKYKIDKKLDISDFESEEEFRKQNLLQIEHYKSISLIQDLPIPPVDTDLIYTSAIETNTGEFIKKDNMIEEGEDFISGGDGTVSTWSSLLVGLKWIYDKQKNNLSQKIRLIEYCSRLKNDFPYKDESNFIAIGCKCLNKDNLYGKFDECDHQKMLLDTNLLKYLKDIVSKEIDITEDRISAAKEVFGQKNYGKICDDQLYKFSKSYNRPTKVDHSFLKNILWIFSVVALVVTIITLFMCYCCKCFACCDCCGCFQCCCRKCGLCYCCKLCRCQNCDCCWDITNDYRAH